MSDIEHWLARLTQPSGPDRRGAYDALVRGNPASFAVRLDALLRDDDEDHRARAALTAIVNEWEKAPPRARRRAPHEFASELMISVKTVR